MVGLRPQCACAQAKNRRHDIVLVAAARWRGGHGHHAHRVPGNPRREMVGAALDPAGACRRGASAHAHRALDLLDRCVAHPSHACFRRRLALSATRGHFSSLRSTCRRRPTASARAATRAWTCTRSAPRGRGRASARRTRRTWWATWGSAASRAARVRTRSARRQRARTQRDRQFRYDHECRSDSAR